MSELAAYYEAFRTGWWAMESADACPCHGSGWALSEVDTWHECRFHFAGQLHPDAREGDIEEFEAAEYESMLAWAVKRGRASLTREESARREAAAAMVLVDQAAASAAALDALSDDEIPF
jgi:hypothetical protein